jgi:hypothetical protein
LTLLEILPPILGAGLCRAPHYRYSVLVVHSDFLLKHRGLVGHLDLHACLLFGLQLLLLRLLVLLSLILLLYLPLERLFNGILVLLLLLHHDCLLVTSLEDSATGL